MILRNIDGLRFIFAMAIVVFHLSILVNLFPQYSAFSPMTGNGAVAVEFFFILSGFLFLRGWTHHPDESFSTFCMKKIKRFWPVVAFSTFMFFLLNRWGLPTFGYRIEDYVYPIFFLHNVGLQFEQLGADWFVSVLFWVLLFYFMLFSVTKQRAALFITGLITFFGYAFLVNVTDGKMLALGTKMVMLSIGLVRGVAGVGVGILLYKAWETGGAKIAKVGNVWIWTLLEAGVLGGLIYFMLYDSAAIQKGLSFVLGFVVLIGLFLMKRGKISQLMDSPVSVFLGRYGYSIFLSHLIVSMVFIALFWTPQNIILKNHIGIGLFVYFECVLLFGAFVYHVIEKPQNCFVKKYGLLKYYVGVFGVTALIILAPMVWIKQQPVPADFKYAFNNPVLNVSARGFRALNWIGAEKELGQKEVSVFFKKQAKLKVNLIVNMMFVPSESVTERCQVILNGNKIADIPLKKFQVQQIVIPVSGLSDVDLKFKFKSRESVVLFENMYFEPVPNAANKVKE